MSQLPPPPAFRDTEGDRSRREFQFEAAVKLAGNSQAAGKQVVFITVVNYHAARFHLPLFVASLKAAGGLDQHLIVATVDAWAQNICEEVCADSNALNSKTSVFTLIVLLEALEQ